MLASHDSRAAAHAPGETPSQSYGPALLVASALLVWGIALPWTLGYQVHDADSRLYIALSQELSRRPIAQWCAPIWGGHWGREGLFVEHPPGLFWAGAVLNRCGLPPHVALYAVNQLAWMLGLGLLWRLAAQLAKRRVAVLAVVLWSASPSFVQYLVRGDQEHPLASSVLLGLVAVACVERPAMLATLWGAALSLALAFKGLPALGLVPLGIGTAYALGLPRVRWVAMGIGTLAAGASVAAFECWYQTQTQHSFVAAYLSAQVGPSMGHGWSWHHKGLNLLYYAARPLWFAQPAVGIIAYGIIKGGARKDAPGPGSTSGFRLGIGALGLFVAAFSLADRKADRYLFAAYPLLALSAAVMLQAHSQAASRLARRWLGRPLHAWACGAGVLALAIALKVYVGAHHYVFIRLWPGA